MFEMNDLGFIRLRRDYETRFEWYYDKNTSALFRHLLLTMTPSENLQICREWNEQRNFPAYKYCVATSIAKLHTETGLSAQNIRKALVNLCDSGHLKIYLLPNNDMVIYVVRAGEYIKEEHEVTKRG